MTLTGAPAAPPAFGRASRDAWMLDPSISYLNHGTVGATPRRVLDAQTRLREAIERQPSAFLLRETAAVNIPPRPPAIPRMRAAAARVAEFLGARADDLVFVDNATAGANAVLRSLGWEAGDEILATDLGYGGVTNTARYVARRADASLRIVGLPFPVTGPGPIVEAIAAALTSRTKLAIVDHVCSESALVMPIVEIAAVCRARGVPLLVDGAHAPGALALDVPAIGADWYVGNLHKWAWAPRSSGILWARPDRQADLHPPVISWGLDRGFTSEFDWVGTRDPSPWLAAPEALDAMAELGVERVRAYNHDLARRAAALLAERWGTGAYGPESMIGTMATIGLPPSLGAGADDARRLRDALLFEDRIEVALHPIGGRLWVRVSAQVYNEWDEFERLGEAVAARAGGPKRA